MNQPLQLCDCEYIILCNVAYTYTYTRARAADYISPLGLTAGAIILEATRT